MTFGIDRSAFIQEGGEQSLAGGGSVRMAHSQPFVTEGIDLRVYPLIH